jgi:(R,R)-butanediol dehydrogenase/meso-butanediol dehydrogenase/diacetyl reductase
MLAVRYYGIRDVRIEVLPRPVCGPKEVLVKVAYAGICGHKEKRNHTGQ